MVERITKVVLEAEIAQFQQNMRAAADATKQVKDQGDKLAETHAAMTKLGTAALVMGAGVGAGVATAVARFADFDEAMSFVAATGEDARGSLDALREAAIDAGASTVFSATESANAIEEMAKAGVDAQDILGGGLKGALDLAAAGGLGVADAAGIAATALKVFKLEGSDMSHVADLLAAGAGKAMGDVTDLSSALAQGGQVAAATGLSIEETTATLAAFASQGLLGSDAGTSFKTMLQRLTPQSKEAQKQFDALGISAYDANGEFIGMAEFAGILQEKMRGLTPEARNAALAVMFGSDAVRAANVVYGEGEEGIRKWISAVDDQGYAAETAATRLDNLKGDWEALTGAVDSALISMGEGADGPLRFFTQELTGLVDSFNDMPAVAQQAVFWVGAVAAAAAVGGGTFLVAVPKIAEYRSAINDLGPTAQRASRIVGTAMKGIAAAAALSAAIAGVDALADRITQGLKPSAEELTNQFRTAKGAAEQLQAGMAAIGGDRWNTIEQGRGALSKLRDALDDAAKAQSNFWYRGDAKYDFVISAAKELGDEYAALAKEDLPQAQANFRELTDAAGLNQAQISTLLNEMKPFKDVLTGLATEQDKTADAQTLLNLALSDAPDPTLQAAAALEEEAAAADEAAASLEDVSDALDNIAGSAMSMSEAKDAALSAIHSLTDAAKEEGAAIDGSNEASIRLRDSVREVETAHRDSAQSILENNGTLEEAQAEWQKGRDAVLDMLEAKGMDREEAVRWADQQLGSAAEVKGGIDEVYRAWLNLPENKETKYKVEQEEAMRRLQDLKDRLSSIPTYRKITLESFSVGKWDVMPNANGALYKGGVKAFADSGFEPGIYPYRAGGIHKFAEEAPEAYISGDPRRRARSEAVWLQAGRAFGFSQPVVNVAAPSLEGMEISGNLEILPNGLARIIDGRIRENGSAVAGRIQQRRRADG